MGAHFLDPIASVDVSTYRKSVAVNVCNGDGGPEKISGQFSSAFGIAHSERICLSMYMNKRVKLHAKRGFDLSKPGRLAERRNKCFFG